MKGAYNCHGGFGVLVRDPDWVIRYKGQEFGGFGPLFSGHLTWAFMAVEGIPFDWVLKELEVRCPVMEVETDTQKGWFQYNGDWGLMKAGETTVSPAFALG